MKENGKSDILDDVTVSPNNSRILTVVGTIFLWKVVPAKAVNSDVWDSRSFRDRYMKTWANKPITVSVARDGWVLIFSAENQRRFTCSVADVGSGFLEKSVRVTPAVSRAMLNC